MGQLILTTDSISGKIQEIITYAKKELFIVSPYIQLSEWTSVKDALEHTLNNKEKEVKVLIIAREQKGKKENKALIEIKEYLDKCRFYLVPDLHSKIYYNEKQALITSMNFFKHSAENNHEIGVHFETIADLEKIRDYISHLTSAGHLVASELKQKEEEVYLSTINNQDLIKERFEVLSKGTKWVKVLNNAGYEDKILLSKVTGLKEGSIYEAMVKKKWHKSGYGIDVEYEEIQDLKKVNGYCIICGKEIEFDPSTPLCKPCYFKNKKFRGNIFGKKCHKCGKEKSGILDSIPLCKDCFYEN